VNWISRWFNKQLPLPIVPKEVQVGSTLLVIYKRHGESDQWIHQVTVADISPNRQLIQFTGWKWERWDQYNCLDIIGHSQ
jgi:hypothetical protein